LFIEHEKCYDGQENVIITNVTDKQKFIINHDSYKQTYANPWERTEGHIEIDDFAS
jgi:hypothetical protein